MLVISNGSLQHVSSSKSSGGAPGARLLEEILGSGSVDGSGGVSFVAVFLSHIMSYHGPTIGDSPKGCNVLLVGGLEHFDDLSMQLGMSSSQLTNWNIFQRGSNHQPVRVC